MYRHLIISILLISILVLSGCYEQLEVSETTVVVAIGWDIGEQNKLLSAQLALTPPREGQMETGPKFMVVSSAAPSFAQAGRRLSLSLPRKPLWSMADIMIMSEKLARSDNKLFIDAAVRNPRFRFNTLVFVSKGATPEDVFQVEVPTENYSGNALEKMLENQTRQAGIYIPVIMKDFLYRSATPGIEPIIPQIVIENKGEQKTLTFQGTAVFRDRKMVGSLDEQQTRGLALLNPGSIKKAIFTIKNPHSSKEGEELDISDKLSLELNAYKTSVKPVINGDNISMKIVVQAEGNIAEDNNNQDLSAPETVKNIEQLASQSIKTDIQACIDQAQSLDSDILGWGLTINRSYPRTWQQISAMWPEIFVGVKSDIEVNYKLNSIYRQRNPFEFN